MRPCQVSNVAPRCVSPCRLGWLRLAKKSPLPEEWVALPRRGGWSDTAEKMRVSPGVAANVAAGQRAHQLVSEQSKVHNKSQALADSFATADFPPVLSQSGDQYKIHSFAHTNFQHSAKPPADSSVLLVVTVSALPLGLSTRTIAEHTTLVVCASCCTATTGTT